LTHVHCLVSNDNHVLSICLSICLSVYRDPSIHPLVAVNLSPLNNFCELPEYTARQERRPVILQLASPRSAEHCKGLESCELTLHATSYCVELLVFVLLLLRDGTPDRSDDRVRFPEVPEVTESTLLWNQALDECGSGDGDVVNMASHGSKNPDDVMRRVWMNGYLVFVHISVVFWRIEGPGHRRGSMQRTCGRIDHAAIWSFTRSIAPPNLQLSNVR